MSGGQGERVGGQNHIRPPAPNKALQPMPYSVRSFLAAAFGHD